MHAVGNLAWEIGAESGQAQMRDDSTKKVDWLVSNVYEKIDGRWLMVSIMCSQRPNEDSPMKASTSDTDNAAVAPAGDPSGPQHRASFLEQQ